MVYEIVFKKRFQGKLHKTLSYLEKEFGFRIAETFAERLFRKFSILSNHPHIGRPSAIENVRSFSMGKRNRVYYRVDKSRVTIINMYDTRMNPAKNRYE